MRVSKHIISQLQNLEQDLFPEQKRALSLMTDNLIDWGNHYSDNVTLSALCLKDEMFFTKESLHTADLPKGKTWQWNQSRSKKHLSVDGELDISFCKLNTRKAKGTTTRSPAYKLWVFHLHFLVEDTWLHFAWCEKGDVRNVTQEAKILKQKQQAIATSCVYEPVDHFEIHLHELSFLREFTDIFTAQQFGWVQ